jgi:hypothetical protein
MYINKIDDLINNLIDDFNISVISDQKIEKIIKEENFIKHTELIKKLLDNYITKINLTDIIELVKNEDNMEILLEMFTKYIKYYFLLIIGFYTKGDLEIYKSHIIKINLFDSENNSIIIKLNDIIQKILILINAEAGEIEKYRKDITYDETIEFMNTLGRDFILENFKVENRKDQSHNIIKSILIRLIYKKKDRKNAFEILEKGQISTEFIYLDIVIPKKKYLEFDIIENLLTNKDISQLENYLIVHRFWDLLQQYENEQLRMKDDDIYDKIFILLNSKLIVPIVEDILLFHKDTEKYDIQFEKKKKQDTRSRFIINKIEKATDLFSPLLKLKENEKLKEKIKNNFYGPMNHRRTILINNYENLNIINKLNLISKKKIDEKHILDDMMKYQYYSYINLKDLDNDGFKLFIGNNLYSNIDAIRDISFTNKINYKKNIQTRVISTNQIVNIIGFAIPSNEYNLLCTCGKNFNKIDKNGSLEIPKIIKKYRLNNKKQNNQYIWIFDKEIDCNMGKNIIKQNKINISESIKQNVVGLYDNLLIDMVNYIIQKIQNHKEISIHCAFKLIEKYEKKIFKIPRNSKLWINLEYVIYNNNYKKIETEYDEQDYIFYGITENAYKLPVYIPEKTKKTKVININLYKLKNNIINESDLISNAVCQHFITYDHIISIRYKNPTKFAKNLYKFLQQYATENNDGISICKSCSTLLDIQKYVQEGSFDENQKFVPLTIKLGMELNKIKEYEKYKGVIKYLEKRIEHIARITNIPYYIGSEQGIKERRLLIVKDTIDIIIINNKLLKSDIKERNKTASVKYGINRNISALFTFELEDKIFMYSSKDTDFYKKAKINNSLIYIMILIILEIPESNISFIIGDKRLCKYDIYERIKYILYGDLKIIKNNNGETDKILNYEVLCYVIYIMSCMVIKYNLWIPNISTDNKDIDQVEKIKNKKQKIAFDAYIQKSVVHTFIDILNSIIELANKNKSNINYNIFAFKYYTKLYSVFKDTKLLQNFIAKESNVLITKKTIPGNINLLINVEKSPDIGIMKYNASFFKNKFLPLYYLQQKRSRDYKYNYHINTITNCKDGKFHEWYFNKKQKKIICNICSDNLESISYNFDKKLIEKYKYNYLVELAKYYCENGTLHRYIYNIDKKCETCYKCKHNTDYKFTTDELTIIQNNLLKNKKQLIIKNIQIKQEIIKEETQFNEYEKQVINKISHSYEKDKNIIYNFINSIKNVQGIDINIISQLKYDTYTIDHNYNGIKLNKPVQIINKKSEIIYIQHHTFFKTHVLYYTSTKEGTIEVYYNAQSKILLGYKKQNNDYVKNIMIEHKIQINHSLLNKIKYMGFRSTFYNYSKSNIVEIQHIMNDRNKNLKKIIYEFQRLINRIKYKYNLQIFYEPTNFNKLINKYTKILDKIQITDGNKKHQIFKHWKVAYNLIIPKKIKEIDIDHLTNISVDHIIDLDTQNNILMFYIIYEINKIFNFNTNNYIQVNIVNLINDWINYIYYLFNEDNICGNIDITKFKYIINLTYDDTSYITHVAEYDYKIKEAPEEFIAQEAKGPFDEYMHEDVSEDVSPEQREKNYDLVEERESLDIEENLDNDTGEILDGGVDLSAQYENSLER